MKKLGIDYKTSNISLTQVKIGNIQNALLKIDQLVCLMTPSTKMIIYQNKHKIKLSYLIFKYLSRKINDNS